MNEDVTMLNLLALSENTYINALFGIFRRCVCVCVLSLGMQSDSHCG